MIGGRGDEGGDPGRVSPSRRRTRSANAGSVFKPLPTAVPPSGIRPSSGSVAATWPRRPDLGGIPAELLPEGHRHGIHQMRATGLHDVGELDGLRAEGRGEGGERRQQVVVRRLQGGQVHRRREHVVRALTEVDVVVRVSAPAVGEGADDLVGVHVRRRARAGLEDVDRELAVVLAGGDRVAGCRDRGGEVAVEQAQFGVRSGRRRLDPAEPVDHTRRDRLAGDVEVLDRFRRLASPEHPTTLPRRTHTVGAWVSYSRPATPRKHGR